MSESSTKLDPIWTAFLRRRADKENLNDALDTPCVLGAIPKDGAGQEALELGCGLGQLAFILSEQRNYQVTAVDSSATLLEEAKKLYKGDKIKWLFRDFSELEFEPNNYDLIVSSLAFHFVPDLVPLIEKCASWLKPNGLLVFSVRHPIRTSNPLGEIRRENGILWSVSQYFNESLREFIWLDQSCYNQHRTISSYFRALTGAGLCVKEIIEPALSKDSGHRASSESVSVPFFIAFSAMKL